MHHCQVRLSIVMHDRTWIQNDLDGHYSCCDQPRLLEFVSPSRPHPLPGVFGPPAETDRGPDYNPETITAIALDCRSCYHGINSWGPAPAKTYDRCFVRSNNPYLASAALTGGVGSRMQPGMHTPQQCYHGRAPSAMSRLAVPLRTAYVALHISTPSLVKWGDHTSIAVSTSVPKVRQDRGWAAFATCIGFGEDSYRAIIG